MNGKKHTAKVVKLAEAAKQAKPDRQPPPQQPQQPKKRKPDNSKPPMIGIQGAHYWCYPCSVSGASLEEPFYGALGMV